MRLAKRGRRSMEPPSLAKAMILVVKRRPAGSALAKDWMAASSDADLSRPPVRGRGGGGGRGMEPGIGRRVVANVGLEAEVDEADAEEEAGEEGDADGEPGPASDSGPQPVQHPHRQAQHRPQRVPRPPLLPRPRPHRGLRLRLNARLLRAHRSFPLSAGLPC